MLEDLLGSSGEATFQHSRAHLTIFLNQALATHLLLHEGTPALADGLLEDDAVPMLGVDVETPPELGHDVVEVIGLDLLARLVEELHLHLVGFLKRLAEGLPQFAADARLQGDPLEVLLGAGST